MGNTDLVDATATAGAAIEQAVAVFMLHPRTYGESVAAGYQNPLAGCVAGRGDVLGEVHRCNRQRGVRRLPTDRPVGHVG